MNLIRNLIEPNRLLLVWQRPLQDGLIRTRHIVGEIYIEDSEVVFRYLDNTPDFIEALSEGFDGFPGFRREVAEHRNNVLYSFTARMTSRKRGDFKDYLAAHFLPENFTGSDFSLLAHTGAKLPGDGFEVIADLTTVEKPFDIVVEVAGTRHMSNLNLESLNVGDHVTLISEPNNPFDANAIAVHHSVGKIGYIPKTYCAMFSSHFSDSSPSVEIIKINGQPERRLIYILLKFR